MTTEPKEPKVHRHHAPFSAGRSRFEYRLLMTLLAGLRALSLERSRALMGAIVGSGTFLSPRLRRVGLENLARAFPERDPAWHRATLHASFRQLGFLAAEAAHFESLTRENIRDFVGFASPDVETAWRERMKGGAAIIATGHFGNWELFAQAQGLMGEPIHIVHRPLRNPEIDDLVTRIRALAGTRVIYKHAAARGILRLLHQGALVAIPIDQHSPGATGAPVPFFGHLARTTMGPARLSQLTGAPIQVAVLARIGETARHEILVKPPHEPPPRGKDPTVLLDTMARVSLDFEAIVREQPEQWLWMHRRWRP